jgi:hypothetical protein
MTSWLRALGMRLRLGALPCLLVASVLATHVATAKPDLPFALLEAFDQAFARVYDAAERRVVELESMRSLPPPARPDVFAILQQAACEIAAACDVASARLDAELAVAGSLSLERRHAVLGCIERHLKEARRALVHAADPGERAEYTATCERLRAVRRALDWA